MIEDWYKDIIVEYQKIINILENTLNQSSKFTTKNCVEINDTGLECITLTVKLHSKGQC